uniref:Osiris 16 n=1 Tax=Glossina palpalis gambiensis TaxID=67801 RepID=A0A1B0B2W2_9MUSC
MSRLNCSYFVIILTTIHVLMSCTEATSTGDKINRTAECSASSIEMSLYCRGMRAVRNIIYNLNKTNKPIVIVRGLEIVPSRRSTDATDDINTNYVNAGNVDNGVNDKDDTLVGRFSAYLRTHELNIKFSELLADETESYLARDLWQNHLTKLNASMSASASEARKKDKGQGAMMMMAVMFSKMMAVMGIGGVGALAMKALGVAMTALVLAGIIGMKSLMSHGHESSHSVQYLTADGHHHRRRRRRSSSGIINVLSETLHNKSDTGIWNSQPLAYRGKKKCLTFPFHKEKQIHLQSDDATVADDDAFTNFFPFCVLRKNHINNLITC